MFLIDSVGWLAYFMNDAHCRHPWRTQAHPRAC